MIKKSSFLQQPSVNNSKYHSLRHANETMTKHQRIAERVPRRSVPFPSIFALIFGTREALSRSTFTCQQQKTFSNKYDYFYIQFSHGDYCGGSPCFL